MNIDTKCEQCSCQVLVFSFEEQSDWAHVRYRTPPLRLHDAIRPARRPGAGAREEMTAEILAVAGAHVARDGAAALSLRSIARDLGMAPSALYRYFDGRDALLTALILTAYGALAAEAERAADQAEPDDRSRAGRPATPSAGWRSRAPCGAGPSSTRTSGGYLRHPGPGLPGARGHRRALRPGGRGAGAPTGGGAQEAGRLRHDEDRAGHRTDCVRRWRR